MWFYVLNVDNNATEMLVNSIFIGNHGVTVSLNGTNSQKTTQFVPEYQCVFICLLSFIDFFFSVTGYERCKRTSHDYGQYVFLIRDKHYRKITITKLLNFNVVFSFSMQYRQQMGLNNKSMCVLLIKTRGTN